MKIKEIIKKAKIIHSTIFSILSYIPFLSITKNYLSNMNPLIIGLIFSIVIFIICLIVFYQFNNNKENIQKQISDQNKELKILKLSINILYFIGIIRTAYPSLNTFKFKDIRKSIFDKYTPKINKSDINEQANFFIENEKTIIKNILLNEFDIQDKNEIDEIMKLIYP